MNFAGTRTTEQRAPRLELKNGKLSIWQGQGNAPLEYDFATGNLVGIDIRRRSTAKGDLTYADFHFTCNGERFDISTIASSSVTADLVGRLSNVKDLKNSLLRIDVWLKDRFTNLCLRENDTIVPFRQLPRVQRIDRGFKIELDSSERDNAVLQLIDEINRRIQCEGVS